MSRSSRTHDELEFDALTQSAPFPDAAFNLASQAAIEIAEREAADYRAYREDQAGVVLPDWPTDAEIAEYEASRNHRRAS